MARTLAAFVLYTAAQHGLRRAGTPGRAPQERRAVIVYNGRSVFFYTPALPCAAAPGTARRVRCPSGRRGFHPARRRQNRNRTRARTARWGGGHTGAHADRSRAERGRLGAR